MLPTDPQVPDVPSGLLGTIGKLAKTAGSGPPAGPDAEARRHAAYHRRIALAGACSAALGAGLGLLLSYFFAAVPGTGKNVNLLVQVPLAFGVGGFCFGVAWACLVAPRAFLTGPAGKPWMKLIGTRSVLAARVVCLLLGLGLAGLAVGVGLVLALTR